MIEITKKREPVLYEALKLASGMSDTNGNSYMHSFIHVIEAPIGTIFEGSDGKQLIRIHSHTHKNEAGLYNSHVNAKNIILSRIKNEDNIKYSDTGRILNYLRWHKERYRVAKEVAGIESIYHALLSNLSMINNDLKVPDINIAFTTIQDVYLKGFLKVVKVAGKDVFIKFINKDQPIMLYFENSTVDIEFIAMPFSFYGTKSVCLELTEDTPTSNNEE